MNLNRYPLNPSVRGNPNCPSDPEHGPMYYLDSSDVYYCPNNEHNSRGKPTRATWPRSNFGYDTNDKLVYKELARSIKRSRKR